MTGPIEKLNERVTAAMAAAFGADAADADPMVRPSNNPKFGDYQSNAAMPLAKKLGKPPRDVATAIVEKLDVRDLCDTPEIAGPGFINLRLTETYLGDQAASMASDERLGITPISESQRVVVDYSSPNVAKEMHVGHLRSTVIGDAIARVLGWLGHDVIRQNHLGDWGTQFGMLIEHLLDEGPRDEGQGQREIGDLNAFYQQAKQRFDADRDFADRARRRVVALQSGDEQTLSLWRQLVEESKHHFARAYRQLNVLIGVDDVRGESTYNNALADVTDALTEQNVATQSEGATVVFVDGYDAPLMVRKSDGGFGYDATDLAAIRYRVDELNADRIIYVTDARQRQHFDMVFKVAERAGWLTDVRADHVPFGMVLGEDNKPFKTRSGETVKLIDLLDEAEQRAAKVVAAKNPDLPADEQQQVARIVGIGAIKYADLSGERTKDYVFNWERMLAMDGNTAPYLQYAYARIQSIFRRLSPSPSGGGGWGEGLAAAVTASARPSPNPSLAGRGVRITAPAERTLILKLLQFGPTVRSVADNLEPHHLCNYLYELATAFSGFYEACPVLKADDESTQRSRLTLCNLTAHTLKQGLNLLGIEVLDRM